MAKPRAIVNKDSKQEMLPHRHALATLTGGDPARRTINHYAKATPGPTNTSPDINQMSGPPGYDSIA